MYVRWYVPTTEELEVAAVVLEVVAVVLEVATVKLKAAAVEADPLPHTGW